MPAISIPHPWLSVKIRGLHSAFGKPCRSYITDEPAERNNSFRKSETFREFWCFIYPVRIELPLTQTRLQQDALAQDTRGTRVMKKIMTQRSRKRKPRSWLGPGRW